MHPEIPTRARPTQYNAALVDEWVTGVVESLSTGVCYEYYFVEPLDAVSLEEVIFRFSDKGWLIHPFILSEAGRIKFRYRSLDK